MRELMMKDLIVEGKRRGMKEFVIFIFCQSTAERGVEWRAAEGERG